MVFIHAVDGTMILMLTEQDASDMRGGRTKFVSEQMTGGSPFYRVVLSLHKNQNAIEDSIRRAGHGKLLEGMPSPAPEPGEAKCRGCDGINAEYLLLDGKCIACWRESALANGEK